MKNKITTLVLFSVITAFSAFAFPGKDKVDPQAFSTFHQKFAEARDVNWVTTDNYIQASFMLNEQQMFAFFNRNGEMVGVSRKIVGNQLPIILQTELKKYKNGGISEMIEFATPEETAYFATIETAHHTTTLKGNRNMWSVYKKVRRH